MSRRSEREKTMREIMPYSRSDISLYHAITSLESHFHPGSRRQRQQLGGVPGVDRQRDAARGVGVGDQLTGGDRGPRVAERHHELAPPDGEVQFGAGAQH